MTMKIRLASAPVFDDTCDNLIQLYQPTQA